MLSVYHSVVAICYLVYDTETSFSLVSSHISQIPKTTVFTIVATQLKASLTQLQYLFLFVLKKSAYRNVLLALTFFIRLLLFGRKVSFSLLYIYSYGTSITHLQCLIFFAELCFLVLHKSSYQLVTVCLIVIFIF